MAKSKQPVLSVVIPAYNEENTIEATLKALMAAPLPQLEIIVVDDGSQDNTREILKKNEKKYIDILILREKNGGKGAALRDGIAKATGEFVVIQDADLEYDPEDLPAVLQPLLDNRADVVYGSRFMGSAAHRVVYFWHYLANMSLTTLSNIFNNLNLSDMETGYKMFRRELLQEIVITENSFGIEPEITAKIAHKKARIYEVGISYHGRTYEEGKKIGLKDAFRAVWVIVKYGVGLKLL
ncbi:MAG: glycosyltransferase family 2 protein [Candidatus Pacebacteria bacterium]|nr:glycosyltransferase family 2 protein [Candidatus Paceibacterota bacterium]PIR63856.1 MAG: glycosyl transferase [Candidatus Pacebacteria bacterium CG10_big_fil_rev_8_21_14_0_10_40_26]PIZ78368.1 MAG: glycosyl transferase [Candidatus Pacebacteria bacterium CG_4_10_14_0_2_um_filter_40_20]PJA68588.1 MAG: glycosyl transferase [Candidatus Pacebacteria bacterium CG_4_9_14_3_um_filter_40_12]PJC41528.1 MAG: glycosyl transferase [Candidatus Pacebacteria bacterium CG_4_9_14_0_2_um_filter_40_15]